MTDFSSTIAFEADLPHELKSVVMCLSWLQGEDTEQCSPKQSDLAKLTGLSVVKVRKSTRELEARGLLERWSESGVTQYSLVLSELAKLSLVPSDICGLQNNRRK